MSQQEVELQAYKLQSIALCRAFSSPMQDQAARLLLKLKRKETVPH